MQNIQKNLDTLKQRIAQAAPHRLNSVQILAVSKRQSSESIRAASELGLTNFGENYLQEALDKQVMLDDLNLCWHYIGRLQSNKTRLIAENFDWVHSLSRENIAQRLNRQRPDDSAPLNVCIQVNIDDDQDKAGVSPDETLALAQIINTLPKLKIRGLMTIPKAGSSASEQHRSFSSMVELFGQLQEICPHADTLSMGMSKDLEIAVQAGATMLRIGEALFGPRAPQ